MNFYFFQRCELCPNRDGALKRTDTNSWAHVVCALYIPEVRFHNVSTMEPIVLGLVPPERYGNVSIKKGMYTLRILNIKWDLNVKYLTRRGSSRNFKYLP